MQQKESRIIHESDSIPHRYDVCLHPDPTNCQLESPYIEPPDDGEPEHVPKTSLWDDGLQDGIAHNSKSIGEFYAKLKSGIYFDV